MWEKFFSFILSQLIPASLFAAPNTQHILANPVEDITIQPIAKVVVESESPNLQARSSMVIETHSNEVLYQNNIWEVMPIASLTKLMTALIVVEKLDENKLITIPTAVHKAVGTKMNVKPGQKISVKSLLYGLLLNSGNDAAISLSYGVSNSEAEFVKLMNEKAHQLGLKNTIFEDSSGLSPNNKSNAFEIAHLAKIVMQKPLLQAIMKEKEITVHDSNKTTFYPLKNTNRLLRRDLSDRVIAGKTGTTPQAGQCLITFIKSQKDRTVMSIILGSQNRYIDIENLISWIDTSYRWY